MEDTSKIIGHLVNTTTGEWFHYDNRYNLYSCTSKQYHNGGVSLCLSQCQHLQDEGEYNEIRRKVAEKRRELKLLESMSMEDIEEFKNGRN